MLFELYEEVLIATDRFEPVGVHRGMKGFVIEIWDAEVGHYEIEIDNPNDGSDVLALITAGREDLEKLPAGHGAS